MIDARGPRCRSGGHRAADWSTLVCTIRRRWAAGGGRCVRALGSDGVVECAAKAAKVSRDLALGTPTSTRHRAPGTGHRAPGTGHRAPGTGHRLQGELAGPAPVHALGLGDLDALGCGAPHHLDVSRWRDPYPTAHPPSWGDSWQSSSPPAETAPPLAAKGRFNADVGCRRTRVLFAGGLLRRFEALPSARARSSGSFQGNHPADVAPVLCRASRSIPRSQQRSRVRCELPQAARPRPAAVAKSRLDTPDTAIDNGRRLT